MMMWLVSIILILAFVFIIIIEVQVVKLLLHRALSRWKGAGKAVAVIIVLVSARLLPGLFMQYYEKYALDYTCEGNIGYSPFTPTKITSIVNKDDPLMFLAVKNVEFTEWEKRTEPEDQFTNGLYITRYRFRYYDEGSEACLNLPLLLKNTEEDIKSLSMFYEQYGFPTKNTEGKCIGVEIIKNFEAQFEFQNWQQNNFKTDYGIQVGLENTVLIDRINEKEISNFKEYNLNLHFENWMLLFGLKPQKRVCSAYYALLKMNNLEQERTIKTHFIKRGFFSFEENEDS